MGLFKKKNLKELEQIPKSLQILPYSSDSDEELDEDLMDEKLDEDLMDEELDEEKEEEVKESELLEEPETKSPPFPAIKDEPKMSEEIDIDLEKERLQKKIDEVNKKIAARKEEEERKKKEVEEANNVGQNVILALQNHEDRIRNLEASMFRVRSSI